MLALPKIQRLTKKAQKSSCTAVGFFECKVKMYRTIMDESNKARILMNEMFLNVVSMQQSE